MKSVAKIFEEAYYRMSIVVQEKGLLFNSLTRGMTIYYNLDSFQTFGEFQKIANRIDSENTKVRHNKVDLYNALVWAEYTSKVYRLPELKDFIIQLHSSISIMQPGYNRAANDLDSFLGES